MHSAAMALPGTVSRELEQWNRASPVLHPNPSRAWRRHRQPRGLASARYSNSNLYVCWDIHGTWKVRENGEWSRLFTSRCPSLRGLYRRASGRTPDQSERLSTNAFPAPVFVDVAAWGWANRIEGSIPRTYLYTHSSHTTLCLQIPGASLK